MTSASAPTPPARPRSAAATAVLVGLALTAGVAMPLQGRVNSALRLELGSPVHAALVSFGSGLALMLLVWLLLPAGRRSVARIPAAVRDGHVRWWQMIAGMIGAVFVFSQALTIPVIGVAVFTVAVVTGQMLGGMTLDRLGWTPAGVQRISPRRLLGALLAFAAVVTVVWPSLRSAGSPGAWLLLALVPLLAGMATSGQQVLNGQQTAHYGNPIPATLLNFVAGTALLAAAAGVVAGASGGLAPLPTTWWMYAGGPLGCVFIALAAFLVPRVGAFLTTLGMVGGQLMGSLLLDVVAPAPGSHVTWLTVLGTLGALVAMVVASTPGLPVGMRRRRRGGLR